VPEASFAAAVTPALQGGMREWRAWVQSARPAGIRRRAGVSQQVLAAGLGVSQGTVSLWERGILRPGDAYRASFLKAVAEMGA
jgi:DNA-binding transcriptional regulator YiaG